MSIFIASGSFTSRNILVVLTIAVLILTIYSYIFLRGSRRILKWYGAEKVQRSERSLLYAILEKLTKKAGVPTPEIFVFKFEIPVMFTVGSRSKSFITVSTPMLEMFDEIKLEALLSHEIGHIKNNDVGINTVTAFLAGLIMSFPNFIMWGSLLLGFGQPEDPAPRSLKFIATALSAPLAATLIHLTNPAKREIRADEIGIKLTGNPRTLAKTIGYLENYISLQPVTDKLNPGHFHLFSTHTQQIRGYLSIFISLFDTHPGIEDRVVHILNHSNDLEKDTLNSNYSTVPGFFDLRSWRLSMAASLFSYLSLLLVIIIMITFVIKDFNFLVSGIVAGTYVGAVMLLMVITARLSIRRHS